MGKKKKSNSKNRSKARAADVSARALSIAQPVPPEDLRIGCSIAVLRAAEEFPSFFWCGADPAVVPPTKAIRVERIPEDAGIPLKVKAVCLPFVFVKSADGERRTLDVRRVSLVRLDEDYAKVVRKVMKSGGGRGGLRALGLL